VDASRPPSPPSTDHLPEIEAAVHAIAGSLPRPHVAFTDAAAAVSHLKDDEYADYAFTSMPDPPWKKARHERSSGRTLTQYLIESRSFHNTESWSDMVQAYSLDEYASTRCNVRGCKPQAPLSFAGVRESGRPSFRASEQDEEHWFYDTLRDEQNRKWAEEKLKKGVRLAKEKKHSEALRYYEQALQLCPRHADTLVARGALLANQGKLDEAAKDLNMALRVDGQVANGRQYLEMVRRKQTLAEMNTNTNVRSYESSFAPPSSGFEGAAPRRRSSSRAGRASDGESRHRSLAPSASETAAAMSTLEEAQWVRSKRVNGEMSEEQLRGLLERKSEKKVKKKREKKHKKEKKTQKEEETQNH